MCPVLIGTTDIVVHLRGAEILTQVGLGLLLYMHMRKSAFALIVTTVSNETPRKGFRLDVIFEKLLSVLASYTNFSSGNSYKYKMVSMFFRLICLCASF